jgi:hypothetical protein
MNRVKELVQEKAVLLCCRTVQYRVRPAGNRLVVGEGRGTAERSHLLSHKVAAQSGEGGIEAHLEVIELVRIVAGAILGEEFAQSSECLVSDVSGVRDPAVRQRGGECCLATPEQNRQELIPDGFVMVPMGLANKVHETF